MTSSQWCFLPKVRIDGELMSKKSLSPKIFDQGTAFLLTACCLALPRIQSSHCLNVLVTCIPMSLEVVWVMDLDRWPSWMWRSLIFFFQWAVVDWALSSHVSHRNLTPATQLSQVLIWWSKMILPLEDLTTMLFQRSHDTLFSCENMHVREKRFAPALEQNFTGHRVWDH